MRGIEDEADLTLPAFVDQTLHRAWIVGTDDHRVDSRWRIVEADGFPIAAKIDLDLSDDRAETVARGTGIGVTGFAEALPKLAPDLLVVLGDRYEILSAAVAATPT